MLLLRSGRRITLQGASPALTQALTRLRLDRHLFHDKAEFNAVFDAFLKREWMLITEGNADELRDFTERQGTIVVKETHGQAGTGVHRYHAADVTDWDAFHAELLSKKQVLVEEVIRQHADLAAVCPGTVNTTRITAFFDGEKTHILAIAQKFGRGQAADQMDFGGFYTMYRLLAEI